MKSERRVVIFAPHFAEYSLRLAIGLRRHGPVLLILDGDNLERECKPTWVKEARAAGVQLMAYRYRSSLSRAIWTVTILLRSLVFHPTLIHVQEQADRTTARIVSLLARLWPIVLTVHDPKPHSGSDKVRAEEVREVRDRIRSAASLFHVHGAHCKALMREVFAGKPREVVETAHGPVLPPSPDELANPVSNRVLFFGRMERYKGLEVLLEASSVMIDRGSDHELVLAGRGEELQRLAKVIEAMPHVRVKSGYLTPAEAIAEIQMASFLVAPYLDATQSGVVAAAYAGGRPVVASEVGGLADSVAHGVTGLLTPPGSVSALAATIEQMIADQAQRDRLASGAKAEINGASSWAAIADTLSVAYAHLKSERVHAG